MAKVVTKSDGATAHVKPAARARRRPATVDGGSFFYHSHLSTVFLRQVYHFLIFFFPPRSHSARASRAPRSPFYLYSVPALPWWFTRWRNYIFNARNFSPSSCFLSGISAREEDPLSRCRRTGCGSLYQIQLDPAALSEADEILG